MQQRSGLELVMLPVAMVVFVAAFVFAVDWILGVNNILLTILIGWLVYKVVKPELAPVKGGRLGGFALYDSRREVRICFGEPEGRVDGNWSIAIRQPGSNVQAFLTCRNGEFTLCVADNNSSEWGILTPKSIEKMVELGILRRPGRDDGGQANRDVPPDAEPQRSGYRQWVERVIHILAA